MKAPSFPKRLLESAEEDVILHEILGAAKADRLEPTRARSVLEAVEAAQGQGAPSTGGGRAAASGWRSSVVVRLAAPLALACAAGLGWRVIDARPPHATVPARSEVASSSGADVAKAPPAPEEEVASPRVADLPDVPAPEPRVAGNVAKATGSPRSPSKAVPSSRPPTEASTPAPSGASLFHEELALVESARSALARGDSAACLRIVESYDDRFRGGVFADEIAVMRIEALAARGDDERARSLGEAFLRKHPSSAYAERIRSVVSSNGPSGESRQK